jgi:hypothetical protein
VDRFAADNKIAVVRFGKDDRKIEVMRPYLARQARTGRPGVAAIGIAQEFQNVFAATKRVGHNGVPWFSFFKADRRVTCFYVYLWDADFGPAFIKICAYFPYPIKVWLNGHEWAKRQAAQAGIAFTALDNGFATCADPAAVQAICDRLGAEQIDALLRKWLAILPHPFSAADRAAGYRYDIAVWQAEFSLTQVLDRPISGRVFFEQVIRDNLDAGRPDQVALIFDRQLKRTGPRATPGPFRTRVITEGVTPSLHIDYKHTKIKQYHKEGRALRTETTINDSGDFRIGKRLTNLPALREVGFSANRRLLGVQRLSHNPIRAAEAFTAVHEPIITSTGQRVAGLRLGDRRAHALLQALLVFRLLIPTGFSNRDLRELLAGLLGTAPREITAGQAGYDLRRLRVHGLIARIPGTHRYRLTHIGGDHAMLNRPGSDGGPVYGIATLMWSSRWAA